jgi:hypothetical protein
MIDGEMQPDHENQQRAGCDLDQPDPGIFTRTPA